MTYSTTTGGWRGALRASAIAATTTALLTTTAVAPLAEASYPQGAGPTREAAPMQGNALRAADQVIAPIPTIDWYPCSDDEAQYECGYARVPLDYDRPNGPTIKLAVLRRLADRPAARIGSLFVNPGGPGGSAVQTVPYFAQDLSKEVRRRFDIVGIDPRGVGGSAPARCRAESRPPRYPNTAFPLTAKQARPHIRFSNWLTTACRDNHNAILDHMSTADTARDMDLVRQALGDKRLNFLGISYGTYLASTYAAMFPSRVRAVIADGVLNPVAWATGRGNRERLPFSTRLGSGVGAWEALTSAFAECDRVSKSRCVLSGHSTEKWERIIAKLRRGPVRIAGGKLTYSYFVAGTLGPLYSRGAYTFIMRDIQWVYEQMFHTQQRVQTKRDVLADFVRRAERWPRHPYGAQVSDLSSSASVVGNQRGPVFSPSFQGVACSDSVNPDHPRRWIRAGAFADRKGPWFGRVWTWASVDCARWPGSDADAFRGPWRVQTANPLLIVSTFHDPATPIRGAQAMHRLFPGSSMISVRTWGHGSLGTSECITRRYSDYLVSGDLPPSGLVCIPDKTLFPVHR